MDDYYIPTGVPSQETVERWKTLRKYGYTCKEIGIKYACGPDIVSKYTKVRKTKPFEKPITDDVEPISRKEFVKADRCPGRCLRGLSGEDMARLLAVNEEYDRRRGIEADG